MISSPDLLEGFATLEAYLAAAHAAPLSAKKAMLAVLLADSFVDRLFDADPAADDILAFRASLAAAHPALAQLFALAALRTDGPRLVTEAVAVPLAAYGELAVEDFMVSLYNDHTVQRVRVAFPDGSHVLVHDLLDAAVLALRQLL